MNKNNLINPVTFDDERIANAFAKGAIYLIDDDILLLDTLKKLLIQEGFGVLTFSDADDFISFLTSTVPRYPGPRCVISDIHMPRTDGLEMQQFLRQNFNLPLILMSGLQQMDHVIAGFRGGAIDFLIKPVEVDRLLQVVNKALDVDMEASSRAKNENYIHSAVASLSAREFEVIRLVSRGQLNRQIAENLGIALRTVKLHRQRAMEKLGIEKVVQLAAFIEAGIL